jgi:hypothetical protein
MRDHLTLNQAEAYERVGRLAYGGELAMRVHEEDGGQLTPRWHLSFLLPYSDRVFYRHLFVGITSRRLAQQMGDHALLAYHDMPFPWALPDADLPRLRSLTFNADTTLERMCLHCYAVFAVAREARTARCPTCDGTWMPGGKTEALNLGE